MAAERWSGLGAATTPKRPIDDRRAYFPRQSRCRAHTPAHTGFPSTCSPPALDVSQSISLPLTSAFPIFPLRLAALLGLSGSLVLWLHQGREKALLCPGFPSQPSLSLSGCT